MSVGCADSSVQFWDFLPERVYFEEDAAMAAAIAASPLHRRPPPGEVGVNTGSSSTPPATAGASPSFGGRLTWCCAPQ